MTLLDSLLDAIVRLDGEALIMHAGEKPFVVLSSASESTFRGPLSWGQVELSSRSLTTDALLGMLSQMLSLDQSNMLEEVGAIEHEIDAPGHSGERFIVTAARGGDDVWVEVRRRPKVVEPVVEPAAPAAIEEPGFAGHAMGADAVGADAEAASPPMAEAVAHSSAGQLPIIAVEPQVLRQPLVVEPVASDAADVELSMDLVLELEEDEASPAQIVSDEPGGPGFQVDAGEDESEVLFEIATPEPYVQRAAARVDTDEIGAGPAAAFEISESPGSAELPDLIGAPGVGDAGREAALAASRALAAREAALAAEADAALAARAAALAAEAKAALAAREAALAVEVEAALAAREATLAAEAETVLGARIAALALEADAALAMREAALESEVQAALATKETALAAEAETVLGARIAALAAEAEAALAAREAALASEAQTALAAREAALASEAQTALAAKEAALAAEADTVLATKIAALAGQAEAALAAREKALALDAQTALAAKEAALAEEAEARLTARIAALTGHAQATLAAREAEVAAHVKAALAAKGAALSAELETAVAAREAALAADAETALAEKIAALVGQAETTLAAREAALAAESERALAEKIAALTGQAEATLAAREAALAAKEAALAARSETALRDRIAALAAEAQAVLAAKGAALAEEAQTALAAKEAALAAEAHTALAAKGAALAAEAQTALAVKEAALAAEAQTALAVKEAALAAEAQTALAAKEAALAAEAQTALARKEAAFATEAQTALAVKQAALITEAESALAAKLAALAAAMQPVLGARAAAVVNQPALEIIADRADAASRSALDTLVPAVSETDADQDAASTAAVVVPIARSVLKLQPPAPPPEAPAASTEASLVELLRAAAAHRASTLYAVVDTRPMMRVEGQIALAGTHAPIVAGDVERFIFEFASRELVAHAAPEWTCSVPGVGRVRCVTFHDHSGAGLIFHLPTADSSSADDLGLGPEVQALCREADGLVVVAGSRSSGKSTLLNAFVDLINRTRYDHVITIESQIRVVHEKRHSFISQREVRGDGDAIAEAARAALREGPDVLVIEDLRAPEALTAALDAARAGRLVFGSISAPTAPVAVERLIDAFPAERRPQIRASLAGVLRAVVAQILVPSTAGGRAAAREVLLSSPAVRKLILHGATWQLPIAIESGRSLGMKTMVDSLGALVRDGVVEIGEACGVAPDRAALIAALQRDGVDVSNLERRA